jgi:predicted O-methyltransferase YrrM/glycosyltransferase involved in cell wall biosynthesis
MNWTDVPGFFDSDLVYKMAVKSATENSVFVEIGTWKGKSTSCMGQLIKSSGKNIKFYAIDTFDGSDENFHQEWIQYFKNNNTSLFDEYEKNLKLCDVYDVVHTIKSTSIEALSMFDDESIDFIFIDGAHDYKSVLDDITYWYPKIKPGGLICGDDYTLWWQEVRDAVDEYFKGKQLFFLNGNLNNPYSQGVWHWCHKKINTQKETDMKVTLYAISKNEEKNIEKFINNSKKFYHTVVVDTGSTDNTVQLLRDAGIEVYEHPQTREEFDFSVARNQALSYVKTDWAFSLDFNEDVDDFFPEGLDIIAEDLTTFKHQRYNDNGDDGIEQSQEIYVRIHRTDNYKWKNAVHELPFFIPTEKYPNEVSVDTTVKITKKIRRPIDKELFYLSICERELKKDPTNCFYVWFIFNHYFEVKNWEKALEYGQYYLQHSKAYFDEFRIQVFIFCSRILLQKNEIKLAANYAFHAVSEAMNLGNSYLGDAFSNLVGVSKVLNNPNITIFATGFSQDTIRLEERQQAIDSLFLTNLDDISSTAWYGHRPFAQWLVSYLKPQVTVDLGTDWGFSTFSFAIPRIGHVYSIDNFTGDSFIGQQDEEAKYNYVMAKREKLFLTKNTTIIKGDFTEVAKEWNQKIDILHIDGDHLYESIKNDYETWSKFVKDDGVILFHDTCVENFNGNDTYGVKKFFEEIDLPKCNFTHTFGLGVVSKNKNIIEHIRKTFNLE